MKEGGARVRLDAISKRFGARVWLTFSPDRLAVLPAGPVEVAS